MRGGLLGLALALSLLGCAGTAAVRAELDSFRQRYEEPQDGARARMRVVAGGTVRLIPGSRCTDWRHEGVGLVLALAGDRRDPRSFAPDRLGLPEPVATGAEVWVRAGEPLVLVGTEGPLGIAIQFVPEAGVDYEFRPLCTRSDCWATLERLAPRRRVEFTRAPRCQNN